MHKIGKLLKEQMKLLFSFRARNEAQPPRTVNHLC